MRGIAMLQIAAIAVAAAIALWPGFAVADDDPGSVPDRGIYFGGSLSGGLAWIDYPDEEQHGKPGAVFDLHFGWRLSPQLMIGGHYGTWGDVDHRYAASSAFGQPPDRLALI